MRMLSWKFSGKLELDSATNNHLLIEKLIYQKINSRLFDPHNTGTIDEGQFVKILKSKQGISDEDIAEMIEGKLANVYLTHFFIYNLGSVNNS